MLQQSDDMEYRPLGRTGIMVSPIAFGAGPVSGLLTGHSVEQQVATVARAVELGINWFDTAATYGDGQSERCLGAALSQIHCDHPLHIATKVRLQLATQDDLRPLVLASVRESLQRLKQPQVTLIQLHNSITRHRNDQPTSVTPEDVLGPRGILAGLEEARDAGLVSHFGLTGIGDADSLQAVIRSGRFATIQAPLHFLNPSSLRPTPSALGDPHYGEFLKTAHEFGMAIFAIRVFAAGALLGAEPSAHTLKTPFFPLALYQRDVARAVILKESVGSNDRLRQISLRYVLSLPEVTSAIIGFGAPAHVKQVTADAALKRLTQRELTELEEWRDQMLAIST